MKTVKVSDRTNREKLLFREKRFFADMKMLLMKIRLHSLTGGSEREIWDISMRRDISSITGRKKELINKGGEKISPAEIDNVLMTHPSVKQAMAFRINDPVLGEDIAAMVVVENQDVTRRRTPQVSH